MSTRRSTVLGFALALLLLPMVARATTVNPPDFNSLVNQADYVVRAVVTSVNSSWVKDGANQHIMTQVALNVTDVIAGSPPQPLVLQLLGGTVDGVTMRVEGAPTFKVGDDNILFIHANGRQFIPLVALSYGQFPVMHDRKSGQDYVMRSSGTPLYSTADVALPASQSGAAPTMNEATAPLTVAAFAKLVRTAGAGAKPSALN